MLSMKFGWRWMKTVRAVAFWKSYHRKFSDPKLNLKNRTWKVPYICSTNTASPKVSSFSLYDHPFQDIVHATISPLTPMLKFQSATKVLKLPRKCKSLYSPTVSTKFAWDPMKTAGAVVFWNFQPYIYGPVLRKNPSAIKFLFFGRSPIDRSDKNCRRSSGLKF